MNDLLHGFFTSAAARWPDHIAVDEPPSPQRPDRRVVTYAALDRWSNALARRLAPAVRGESVVAILLPRGADVYAAQLAVLKSGAAYTCIDPQFPDERARWMLDDAAAVALITDDAGRERARAAGWSVPIVDVGASSVDLKVHRHDSDSGSDSDDDPVDPPAWLSAATLAYLIYTSGTTGRPKGVAVEHGAIANLVAADIDEFQLTPADRVGQNSSTSYDSSIEELWLAFAAGATVVVIDDDTARMGPDVIPFLQRERVTVFCPPPTLLRATGCTDPATALPDLTLLYVGGEALPRDVVDLWAPGRRLSNGYGPTECAVTAIRGDVRAGEPVSIGRPARGVSAAILNEALEEVGPHERGELCIGGAGLARGYWRRPDLTADRFITHPRLGRLYRTGDLAHRDDAGVFFCHGRVDSQVKIRGYRIELDEIDAQLQECDGVREAAAVAQTTGMQTTLVAFVVAKDESQRPDPQALKAALGRVLPSYMVPVRFGFVSELPRTLGGKLNRTALPELPATSAESDDRHVSAATPLEQRIAAAVQHVLGLGHTVSVQHDFFRDLGGDSLAAALLVTRLRETPETAWVAVRDIYDARTVEALASRAPIVDDAFRVTSHAAAPSTPPVVSRRASLASTCIQIAWLAAGHITASAVAYAGAFVALPWLMSQASLTVSLLVLPPLALAAMALYAPLALLLAVTVKRVLIGHYRPMAAPVWSAFYVRHWIVVAVARLVPWRMMQGTVFHVMALRALGARIGRRVHIHRGVDLTHGGWDLLTIGDDVSIGQDVAIGLVELDGGRIVSGPVSIGDGAVLEVRAGVTGDTVIGANACLSALSSLPAGGRIPAGERWDGIPARKIGPAEAPPALTRDGALPPLAHGLAMIAAESAVSWLKLLPLAVLGVVAAGIYGLSTEAIWAWLAAPSVAWLALMPGLMALVASVPLTLAIEAVIMRALGSVRPGVISVWSLGYVRVWLKTGLLQSAGNWLSGTLFWPVWLRAAGMTIGARCEVSTIIDVVPELMTFGEDVFLADGIYLAGPRVQRGTVTLAATSLGDRTFLGNHVVIPIGQHLPDDILLGVCTVADDRVVRPGSSWFGHPPFELPRREVVEMDRAFTHHPSAIRYWNRVFWEALRITLPVVPALVIVAWFRAIALAESQYSVAAMVGVVAPMATLGALVTLCLVVLIMKWGLLGRVTPGQHPLWSCWCSRWDFLYVAWNQYASPALASLEGTLLLPWYLRAMGMRIGRGVVLGPGFAQVVDPDMLTIEDGATVHAMFQAHTFEDRVLKIDHVRIRRQSTLANGTVVLYGADIGEGTHVAPHSVVMKHERLEAGRSYEGAPVRPS